MIRLRHSVWLLSELVRMSFEYRSWLLVPVVVIIVLLSLLAVAVQLTVPFAVYTLF